MGKIKKILSLISMMTIMVCGCLGNVYAGEITDDKAFTPEEVEDLVIANMILEGIIDEEDVENECVKIVGWNDSAVMLCNNENDDNIALKDKAIIVQNDEDSSLVSQVVVPMMKDEDGNLVNAINYLSGVPTSRTFSHNASEYSFCTMNIQVIYDYYYPQNNGYQDPYYQHGRLLVKFIYDSTIYAPISGLRVAYVSQGYVTDTNGYTTGEWAETVTRVNQSTVKTNTTYGSTSASNGNLYFARDISDEIAGNIACSGVAYRFVESGTEKTGAMPIIYDQNYSESAMIFYMESEQMWD